MAIQPLKCELEMGLGDQTWTESHYYLPGGNLPVNPAPFQQLASYRAGLLGRSAFMIGLRVSEVPANRVVQDISVGANIYTGSWPADPTNTVYQSALPNVAVLLKMNAEAQIPGPEKSLYLAGVPVCAVSTANPGPSDLGINANFLAELGLYMNYLTGSARPESSSAIQQQNWGFRSRAFINTVDVVGLVTNSGYPGMIGIQVQNALPNIGLGPAAVPPGTSRAVYVTNFRRYNTRIPGLSGAWTVGAILPPVAPAVSPYTYFLLNSGNVSPTNFLTGGKICPLTFIYPAYAPYWNIEKGVTRKRGGSLGLRRGRSRSRR